MDTVSKHIMPIAMQDLLGGVPDPGSARQASSHLLRCKDCAVAFSHAWATKTLVFLEPKEAILSAEQQEEITKKVMARIRAEKRSATEEPSGHSTVKPAKSLTPEDETPKAQELGKPEIAEIINRPLAYTLRYLARLGLEATALSQHIETFWDRIPELEELISRISEKPARKKLSAVSCEQPGQDVNKSLRLYTGDVSTSVVANDVGPQ